MAKANLYNPNVLTMVGFTLMALALMFMPSTHAEAVDLFVKGRTNIKDTFGLSSTVVWILYIIEGLGAVFTYSKTKNLAVLVVSRQLWSSLTYCSVLFLNRRH